jgi:hypothetical protein
MRQDLAVPALRPRTPGAPLRLKVWKLDGYVDHEDS